MCYFIICIFMAIYLFVDLLFLRNENNSVNYFVFGSYQRKDIPPCFNTDESNWTFITSTYIMKYISNNGNFAELLFSTCPTPDDFQSRLQTFLRTLYSFLDKMLFVPYSYTPAATFLMCLRPVLKYGRSEHNIIYKTGPRKL